MKKQLATYENLVRELEQGLATLLQDIREENISEAKELAEALFDRIQTVREEEGWV